MKSRHIEFYLRWCISILKTHSGALFTGISGGGALKTQESFRNLIRAVSKHEKEIMTACDLNQYSLCFLTQQLPVQSGDSKCVHMEEMDDTNLMVPEDKDVPVAMPVFPETTKSSRFGKR